MLELGALAASAFDTGYALGRIAFYVVLIVVIVAIGTFLWRRRR